MLFVEFGEEIGGEEKCYDGQYLIIFVECMIVQMYQYLQVSYDQGWFDKVFEYYCDGIGFDIG